MNMSSKNKFYSLGFMALILVFLAFYTFSSTYCLNKKYDQYNIFNVSLKEISKNNSIFVNKNIVDFKDKLKLNTEKEYKISLANSGNMNGKIDSIIVDGLDTLIGEDKITNQSYYLKDYVDVFIKYTKSNQTNDININDRVSVNDLIKANTSNEFKIILKRRGENELSLQALKIFNDELLDVNLRFKINIIEE